jgi:UDP-glucose 4-epimerase
VGGTIEIPIVEVAKTIIRLTGSSSEIRFVAPLEEGDMTRRKPDTAKMSKLINRPLVGFEEGLLQVVNNTSFILQ